MRKEYKLLVTLGHFYGTINRNIRKNRNIFWIDCKEIAKRGG